MKRMRISAAIVVSLSWAMASHLSAEDKPPVVPSPGQVAKPDQVPSKKEKNKNIFLRVQRDEKSNPLTLDTAVVRYVSKNEKNAGVVIDLIGAVHVGERSYYDDLNKSFKQYDALLYELVAPEGTRVPKNGGGGSGHPVGMLQQGMKNMLELDFQLERVDYQAVNFVHADMTPEELEKSMADRNDGFLQMALRMMGQGIAQQGKESGGGGEMDMLFALFSKDRALKLKRTMAEQFEDLEGSMAAISGPNGSSIITERNRKAFEVLQRELDKGKKTVGVFYGAGHLPDMEKRLDKDFGFKRAEVRWLTAWNLQAVREKKAAPKPALEPLEK